MLSFKVDSRPFQYIITFVFTKLCINLHIRSSVCLFFPPRCIYTYSLSWTCAYLLINLFIYESELWKAFWNLRNALRCGVAFEKTFACRFVLGALVKTGRDTAARGESSPSVLGMQNAWWASHQHHLCLRECRGWKSNDPILIRDSCTKLCEVIVACQAILPSILDLCTVFFIASGILKRLS